MRDDEMRTTQTVIQDVKDAKPESAIERAITLLRQMERRAECTTITENGGTHGSFAA
jgi:hypothetical protein